MGVGEETSSAIWPCCCPCTPRKKADSLGNALDETVKVLVVLNLSAHLSCSLILGAMTGKSASTEV